MENAIGSGLVTTVSKVEPSCVCWKTLKDDYSLNVKAKLVFFWLKSWRRVYFINLTKNMWTLRPISYELSQFFEKTHFFSRQKLENLIGSGSGKTVSKVHRSCVCWKTFKDDYSLNLKAKMVFFWLISWRWVYFIKLLKNIWTLWTISYRFGQFCLFF